MQDLFFTIFRTSLANYKIFRNLSFNNRCFKIISIDSIIIWKINFLIFSGNKYL